MWSAGVQEEKAGPKGGFIYNLFLCLYIGKDTFNILYVYMLHLTTKIHLTYKDTFN